jgi:hypothetical protein
MRSTVFLLLLSSLILDPSSFALADGGAVRLSQREGNYQITVLTAPTPLRAGPIDISVLVQNALNNELVLEGRVAVTAIPRDHPAGTVRRLVTAEAATNKLFRAAEFELGEPGWWDVEVSIDGPLGNEHAQFEMEAAPPLPKWLALWPWFGWPALAIALFGVHQLLIHSSSHPMLRDGRILEVAQQL